jgi:hypothetical protein
METINNLAAISYVGKFYNQPNRANQTQRGDQNEGNASNRSGVARGFGLDDVIFWGVRPGEPSTGRMRPVACIPSAALASFPGVVIPGGTVVGGFTLSGTETVGNLYTSGNGHIA